MSRIPAPEPSHPDQPGTRLPRRTGARTLRHLALAAGLALGLSAQAQAQANDGEVRKVDRAQGKLTLRHGEIASLQMPPMTMVFRVADPAMLEGLQPGRKVKFDVESLQGVLTIVKLTPVD